VVPGIERAILRQGLPGATCSTVRLTGFGPNLLRRNRGHRGLTVAGVVVLRHRRGLGHDYVIRMAGPTTGQDPPALAWLANLGVQEVLVGKEDEGRGCPPSTTKGDKRVAYSNWPAMGTCTAREKQEQIAVSGAENGETRW